MKKTYLGNTKAERLTKEVYYRARRYYESEAQGREEELITMFDVTDTRANHFFRTVMGFSREEGAVSIRTLNDIQKELNKIRCKEDGRFRFYANHFASNLDDQLANFKKDAMAINLVQRSIDNERRHILEARAKDKEEIENGTGFGHNEWSYTEFGR